MSDLEDLLILQIRAVGLPEPVRELRFCPSRRWRFDFAWPDQRIGAEVEGGLWGGRHVRPTGYTADCEKYNEAAIEGWRVVRFTAEMIHSGRALTALESILAPEC